MEVSGCQIQWSDLEHEAIRFIHGSQLSRGALGSYNFFKLEKEGFAMSNDSQL